MDKPVISVAMCTYNGERFLVEQLNSILTQTYLPDELVIFDDGSSDNTLSLLENFKKTVLFEVKIHRNQSALGTTKNFEAALKACRGDYLFLCDQDDVWLPEKIEKMVRFLNANPTTELVFSDAQLVNEELQPMERTQWNVVRFDENQQQRWLKGDAIGVMLGGNRVTGCTVAIRRSLLEVALPFPTDIPEVIHDNWLAWVATVRQSIRFLPEVLTLYRQHTLQQIGSRPRPKPNHVGLRQRLSRPRAEKLIPLISQREELQKLYLRLSGIEKNQEADAIGRKLDYLTTRSQLPPNRLLRIGPTVWGLIRGNYHRYQDQEADAKAPWLAFLGDLIE